MFLILKINENSSPSIFFMIIISQYYFIFDIPVIKNKLKKTFFFVFCPVKICKHSYIYIYIWKCVYICVCVCMVFVLSDFSCFQGS